MMRSFICMLLSLGFVANAQAWKDLADKGDVAYDAKDYVGSETYYKQALQSLKKEKGLDNLEASELIGGLAVIHSKLEKYADAEQEYVQSKNLKGKFLGTNSAGYALACNSLALLYYNQGAYAKAEPIYLEAIAAHADKKDDANYAVYCSNLALLYKNQKTLEKAIPYYLEAMAVYAKISGKDKDGYVNTASDLALAYRDLEQYEKSAELYQALLKAKELGVGKKSAAYAITSNDLALVYYYQKAYEKAEEWYIVSRDIFAEVSGKQSADYLQLCSNLALLYSDQGLYAKAEENYAEVLQAKEKLEGKSSAAYGLECNNMALACYYQNKYDKAELYYKEAMKAEEASVGKKTANYIQYCKNLALIYSAQGTMAKVEPLYVSVKELKGQTLGTHTEGYALACNDLALLYYNMGLYPKAEDLYIESKNILEKVLGKENVSYINVCNNLALLYCTQGVYGKSETLYVEAKNIEEKVLGKDNANYALACNNLGLLYYNQGLYSKAEVLYKEAKAVQQKVVGTNNLNYAEYCNNLALLYQNQGLFTQAEPLYVEALGIKEALFGKQSKDYALTCSNLGYLYFNQGLYEKAERLYIESKDIREKVLGKGHPDYALACNNLAVLYDEVDEYDKAEDLYLQARNVYATVLGKKHPSYALSCNNLALLHYNRGNYDKAENLYLESIEIFGKVLGKEHPDYALACSNLALIYSSQKKFPKAEKLCMEAKDARERIFGKAHPDYAMSCNNLAYIYVLQEQYAKAEPLFNESVQNKIKQIQTLLPTMSETERAAYIKSIQFYFNNYYSFALNYQSQKPEISAQLFNLQLALKGLVFHSTLKMREQILNSKDQNLIQMYHDWKSKRDLLAKTLQMKAEDLKTFDKAGLIIELNELERKLSQKSEAFAKTNSNATYTWEDLKQKLKADEVVVEIKQIRPEGAYGTRYIALIVKPNSPYPEMVVLDNGDDLENKYIKYYINAIKYQFEDKNSYKMFWSKIKERLGDAQKVYLSPDMVYHKLNLLSLKNPATNQYLIDEVDVQLVSSSKDLITLGQDPEKNKINYAQYQVHLFGYPEYSGEGTKVKEGKVSAPSPNRAVVFDTTQRFLKADGTINKLPGTKKEVEAISGFCKSQKVATTTYMSRQASEEAIKKLKNPDILHIATHGFFNASQGGSGERSASALQSGTNALQNCGLLLSNAEETYLNGATAGKENGILTAEEAMNLHLDNTNLVVLSACETGLGETKNGEGVSGLQSAFQQAGAKTVLMSLWTVSDEATQSLMSFFYENMLVKKQSKREAFKNAQLQVKQKYPSPFYWSAFVMIGE